MAENNIKLLRGEAYPALLAKLLESTMVYGPVVAGGRVAYRRIASPAEVAGADDYLLTDLSPKAFVFPRVEKLLSYTKSKDGVEVRDFDPERIPHRVVVGVRPCDASGIVSLGAIFEWDPADPIYAERLARTTIVSLSCKTADSHCFCTSVGGGPGNTRGSDILLTRMDDGDYIVEILTPKGEALVTAADGVFETYDGASGPGGPAKERYLADVPRRFDDSDLEQKVTAAFDTDLFDRYAVRCIGCSACAFVCPSCACFDIQDNTRGSQGQRIRGWDSCGAKLFTQHTSGHNPRETQGPRWRQRLMHKFSYMPERLDVRGCAGCGRCSRRCPAGMDIAESLAIIINS